MSLKKNEKLPFPMGRLRIGDGRPEQPGDQALTGGFDRLHLCKQKSSDGKRGTKGNQLFSVGTCWQGEKWDRNANIGGGLSEPTGKEIWSFGADERLDHKYLKKEGITLLALASTVPQFWKEDDAREPVANGWVSPIWSAPKPGGQEQEGGA